ncbi:UNVERIFIED_ORG: hypothetical protein GGI57_000454 [Rhizobium aethiopicum]
MNKAALDEISNPATKPADYATFASSLSVELVERAIECGAFPLTGIHAVSAAADYKIVLEPAVEFLRSKGYLVATSCIWPVTEMLMEGVVDRTTISMAMSDIQAPQMPQLLVLAQAVSTFTELEAVLTHVLFDMGPVTYKRITVLSLVSHVDAERHLNGMFPQEEEGKLLLLDHRKDTQLTLTGELKPGIGGRPIDRAGFLSYADSRSFVPAAFRDRYDFTSRPKPSTYVPKAPGF